MHTSSQQSYYRCSCTKHVLLSYVCCTVYVAAASCGSVKSAVPGMRTELLRTVSVCSDAVGSQWQQ